MLWLPSLDPWTPFRRALLGDHVATSICQLEISSLPGWSFFSTFRKSPVVSLENTVLRLDPVGIALAMAAIICFVLGLRYGGTSHLWNSSQVIDLLIGFNVICIALFILKNFLDEYAMLLPRLFKKAGALGRSPLFIVVGDIYVINTMDTRCRAGCNRDEGSNMFGENRSQLQL